MTTPEDKARENIDHTLRQAGWVVQDLSEANLGVSRGVAIRNFPLEHGHGFADYLRNELLHFPVITALKKAYHVEVAW